MNFSANASNGTSTNSTLFQAVLPPELKATLVVLIDLAVVLGNGFVIFVILKSSSMRNCTGYLTVSLACADVIPGLLIVPFSVRPTLTGQWQYGESFCMTTTFLSCICALASVSALTCLAINRYILIIHALSYQTIMTRKVYVAMIVITWLLPVLCFAGPVLGLKRFYFVQEAGHCSLKAGGKIPTALMITAIAVFVLIVGVLHWRVYRVAVQQANSIQHYNPHDPVSRLRGLATTATITGVFFVTWLPFCVLVIWQDILDYPAHPDVIFFCYWFYVGNGIWNVFIYSGMNTIFREAARKCIHSWVQVCGSRATHPNDPPNHGKHATVSPHGTPAVSTPTRDLTLAGGPQQEAISLPKVTLGPTNIITVEPSTSSVSA